MAPPFHSPEDAVRKPLWRKQARLLWAELDADLQSLPLRCSEGVNQLRQS